MSELQDEINELRNVISYACYKLENIEDDRRKAQEAREDCMEVIKDTWSDFHIYMSKEESLKREEQRTETAIYTLQKILTGKMYELAGETPLTKK